MVSLILLLCIAEETRGESGEGGCEEGEAGQQSARRNASH